MITAQDLYDRRDEYGEIDGCDLHKLFQELTGDPSPAGRTPIDAAQLAQIAAESRAIGDTDTARFCGAFVS